MQASLKVAIVGCGQIADGHVTEIQKLQRADVVAVCDLEPLMAEQLAIRFGVPAHYSHYAAMLEREAPDVVHICTPPSSHLALARAAADAGAHVYVEKPLTLSYKDSCELIAYVEQRKRKLTIGHTYLFDPPAEDLRRLMEKRKLGDIVHVDSWYGYDINGPFGKVILCDPNHWVHTLPGKLFQNNIDHLLNKITEFLPDEQPQIQASAWRRDQTNYGDVRDDLQDELRVILRGESVSAYATFSSNVKPLQAWARVYGTNGTAHVDYTSRIVTIDSGIQLPSALGRLAAGMSQSWAHTRASAKNALRFAKSEFHFFAGLNELFKRFYAHIRDEGPEPISMGDIKRIAWMMDEIFRQIGRKG